MTKTKIIEKILIDTREHCNFKKAFLPRGWTCVNIKKAALDIAKALNAE